MKTKITKKMVKYWLGADDPLVILAEIANSKYDQAPWTPNILHDDIKTTCGGKNVG